MNASPPATAQEDQEFETEESSEEFGELLKFTLVGYLGGLLLGGALDAFGYQRSAVGQWIVRTVSGESESLLEGIFALRQRLRSRSSSMAEAYGWGKLIGMTIPWWIDWISRAWGVNVYGVEGFYIPFFYAMSDQIAGNISGLIYLRRDSQTWSEAFSRYLRHPVMLSGWILILFVPVGLYTARSLGFVPETQVLTALETMISNLCWIPPLVGWIQERRSKRRDSEKSNGGINLG